MRHSPHVQDDLIGTANLDLTPLAGLAAAGGIGTPYSLRLPLEGQGELFLKAVVQ